MANIVSPAIFERTLAAFKSNLKRRDQDKFKFTTLTEMHDAVADLQSKQHSSRRQQNLGRLKPFLEAVEQWGKVVDTFANSSEFVAFVWVGDLKLQSLAYISLPFTHAYWAVGTPQVPVTSTNYSDCNSDCND